MHKIIDHAKVFCTKQKERLTQPRLEVLKIIAESKSPLKAYEILSKLGKVIQTPKPPTVYRAIEFWQHNGFIHRIESLNAYAVCQAGHRHKESQFLICDDCGIVIEAHLCKLPKALQTMATQNAFSFSSCNIEIHGRCFECQTS